MLRATFGDRYDAIGIGISTYHPQYEMPYHGYLDFPSTNDFRPGWALDLFFTDIALDFPLGDYSAYTLCGMDPPLGPLSLTMGQYRPEAVRDYSPERDWGRYGSIIGGVLNLGRPADPTRNPDWTRETEVRHSSGRGSLNMGGPNRYMFPYRQKIVWYGQPIQRFSTAYNPSVNAYYLYDNLTLTYPNDLANFQPGHSGIAWNHLSLRVPFDELAAWCLKKGFFFFRSTHGYAENLHTYSNFEYSEEEWEGGKAFMLEYYFTNTAWSSRIFPPLTSIVRAEHTYRVKWRLKVKLELPSNTYLQFQTGVPTSIRTSAITSFYRAYELVSETSTHSIPSNFAWPTGDGDFTKGLVTTQPHILYRPASIVSRSGHHVYEDKRHLLYRAEEGFQHLKLKDFIGSEVHPHCRAAAAISSNDALSNYHSDSNFLESIPELPSVLRMVKDISKFGIAIKKIASGDPGAIPYVIDTMASAYLAYQYGARPLPSDISEAHRIATMYWNHMEVTAKGLPGVLNGKFPRFLLDQKVPDFEGKLFVSVRSKMVLKKGPAGLLAYVMALDEAGMLPTLTRIWDLAPFSFVVDWFTGLSNKFETIDRTAMRACLEVDYYVHTWTYSFFPDDRMYFPFQGSRSARPELRVFVREKSLHHPLFIHTKYDFHPPSGVEKHLLSAGALLWVLS